jgi:hypothetical protein
MVKLVITGHTSGIGRKIYNHYGGIGLSKSTGFDISIDDIVPHLQSADIFINNAYDKNNPWAQTDILYKSVNKCNRIICIGSNTTDEQKDWIHPYQAAKQALETACNQLFYQGHNITLIKFGLVDTPMVESINAKKIGTEDVITYLQFIINSPYKIPSITVVP